MLVLRNSTNVRTGSCSRRTRGVPHRLWYFLCYSIAKLSGLCMRTQSKQVRHMELQMKKYYIKEETWQYREYIYVEVPPDYILWSHDDYIAYRRWHYSQICEPMWHPVRTVLLSALERSESTQIYPTKSPSAHVYPCAHNPKIQDTI